MSNSTFGLFLALGALSLWSLSPFFFTATGRRIGPFATNLLRLQLAMPLLLALCVAQRLASGYSGLPGADAVLLLALSGWVGLGLGDYYLYRSFYHIGPERTSLLISLAPAATAVIAWFWLREILSLVQIGGMALILSGLVAATWRPAGGNTSAWSGASNGVIAAMCLGLGTVLAREAFLRAPDLSPLDATVVRVGAAAALIFAIAGARGLVPRSFATLRDPWIRKRMLLGTLVGPVGGMSLYVAAMKYQPAGVVATITFMTPLIVMPLGAWHYGTRFEPRTLIGAAAAVAGIALLGLNPGD